LSDDPDQIARGRYLASQARQPVAHFEHVEVGYNYRLSNLLASLGRAQLARLDGFVERTREIHARYRRALKDIDGIDFLTEAKGRHATHWLTCMLLDEKRLGASPTDVCKHLESRGIEARPVWKPMHLQPAFADCSVIGGTVAEELFARGVCLPSGSSLSHEDQQRVVEAFLATPGLCS
jgi:dTDP-4-amino-4,6-dideoxygalactose transaminase